VADGTAGREEGREGFRVPACDDALALLRAAGGLLRVTSANLSGEPPALTAGAAARELRDFVDMVLDAGPARGGTPSTVVEVRESKIRVLREGAVSLQELEGQT
jgi:L-threonylcarbamoyladenylate synthase